MTARKTIALTIQTFVGKVMSLLFNTLSRFKLTEWEVLWIYIYTPNNSQKTLQAVFSSSRNKQQRKVRLIPFFFFSFLFGLEFKI